MKPKLLRSLVVGLTLLAAAMSARGQGATYTVTNQPGWNLIANQFDSPNGNNIHNVIPSAPIGSLVKKFNLATKSFGTTEILTAAGGWLPGTNVFNPGEGLYFSNALSSTFVMTFSGLPHLPVLPLNIGAGVVLVARQSNAVATISNILGYNPPNLTVLYEFIPGAGHDPNIFASSNYIVHGLVGGAWTSPPGPPTNIHVGQAVWIITNGALPVVRSDPKGQAICPGGTATLTVSASGTPPLSYQWLHNNNPVGGNSSSYTIAGAGAADGGTYVVKVSNPLGSTISATATIAVGDFSPPVLTCPNDITTSCRGPGGTPVSFSVGVVDDCDPKAFATCVPPSGSVFPGGVTAVICTSTDASGNTGNCSFTVTVQDKVPPTISCPPDRVVAATSSQGAQVFFNVTAADNCDLNPSVTANPPSGSIFPIGTTTVNATAQDASGNASSCSFAITVVSRVCCLGKLWSIDDVSGPGSRDGHVMAYDSNRGRVVLFGGTPGSGFLGDTWEWDGATWTLMTTSGPSPRAYSAMAYDSRIGRTVLFGGLTAGGGGLADTWLWDGVAWQQLNLATAPPARAGHGMAYDSARGRSVLFGGSGATTVLSDTWEFDGAQWFSAPSGAANPGARTAVSLVYGSAQKQLLLFGGERQGTNFFGDTWNWDGNAWTMLDSNGPPARAFTALAYNDNCDSVVLFGGLQHTNYLSDTWEWNGRSWTLTGTNNPFARAAHALAHDSAHAETVLFGGVSIQGVLGDTHHYGADQSPPQVRSVYAACGDQRIVVAFDKAMDPASVQDPSNYQISCGGVVNAVTGVVVSDDPRIVWLTTSQPINSNPLTGSCCTLIIGVLRDTCGHALRGYQGQVCCTAEPCPRGSAGAEYWLTFPGNYAPDPTNPPVPKLFITGPAGVLGSVSISGLSGTFTIPASGVATITLPKFADLGNANDTILSNGVHVVTSQPVSVYGLDHIKYTSDAYLGLSTKALGRTYLIMAYPNLFTGVPELNGVQFAIAAAQDNTTVAIVPSSTVGSHLAGVPYLITMMQGQTYQLRNTNDAPADLSGTIVVADQPIAVFGSHQCANIPNTNTFFCDYLVEQLPPTEIWGFNFITVPLAGRLFGDTFHIMALLNNTTVSVNGAALPALNQGKYAEVQLIAPAQITSDKPVLVAQFSDSSDFDLVKFSDPFMVIVPSTPTYSTSYTLQSPVIDFTSHYINLMSPAAGVGQIILDGAAVPAGSFSPVGASGYSVAQVSVSNGPHTLTSVKNIPFGAIAYGWGEYDGYGYPGGTCNSPQGQPPRFSCPPTNVVVRTAAGCQGAVPDLTSQVGNAASAIVILQDPPAGTLLGPGTYPITLTIVDPFGQRQICHSSVTILVTGAGLFCPQIVSTNCASTNGQFVSYNVGVCNPTFDLTCIPPSGSFFPLGVTSVSCVAKDAAGATDKCAFPVSVSCTTIGVAQTTGGLTVSWTGTGFVQKAPSPTGPWTTLSNAPNPLHITVSGKQGFFRVVQ